MIRRKPRPKGNMLCDRQLHRLLIIFATGLLGMARWTSLQEMRIRGGNMVRKATNSYQSKIPKNIIFNSKGGINSLPQIIMVNINHTVGFYPGWTVISDDDAGCLRKIRLTDALRDSIIAVENWYNTTQGMVNLFLVMNLFLLEFLLSC